MRLPWKVGDKWAYKTQDGKIRTETVAEITKELFILDIGGKDRLGYEKSTMKLEFLVDPRGEKTKYRGWQEKIFYFPLYVGKTWSYSYSHYSGERGPPICSDQSSRNLQERFYGRQTSHPLVVVVVQKERRGLPINRPD